MDELGQLLLVEDNPDDYESMLRGFRKANLLNPVHWCTDGQDALDYLGKSGKYRDDVTVRTPALILLDLNLPGLDGRRLLSRIKDNPETRHVPVVILTTSNNQTDINKCYALGANTYIQKPVGFEGLVEASSRLKGYWFGIALLPERTPGTGIET
jgi:CheY-like chemotaxis protein